MTRGSGMPLWRRKDRDLQGRRQWVGDQHRQIRVLPEVHSCRKLRGAGKATAREVNEGKGMEAF
jgi:hypothetical protein